MWKRISLYVTKSRLPGASPAGSPASLTAQSESIIDYLSQSSSLIVHFLQVMVLRFLPSCSILSLCAFLPFPGLQIQSFCSFTSNTYILLLLLSLFSCARLSATPQTAAHQAPPSLGFPRQEHWSGLPFPSPMHESEKWKWSRLVVSYSSRPQPTRLFRLWDFPGKSTGMGCQCLLHHYMMNILPFIHFFFAVSFLSFVTWLLGTSYTLLF